MSDRELLELAAKAAGIDFDAVRLTRQMRTSAYIPPPEDDREFWNPLADDGDALRLAVKLRLNIQHYARTTGVMCVQAAIDWGIANDAFHEEHGANPGAATRRAIVRAAAAIGEQMP